MRRSVPLLQIPIGNHEPKLTPSAPFKSLISKPHHLPIHSFMCLGERLFSRREEMLFVDFGKLSRWTNCNQKTVDFTLQKCPLRLGDGDHLKEQSVENHLQLVLFTRNCSVFNVLFCKDATVGVGDSNFSVIKPLVLIYSSHAVGRRTKVLYIWQYTTICTMKSGSESEQICIYLTVVWNSRMRAIHNLWRYPIICLNCIWWKCT